MPYYELAPSNYSTSPGLAWGAIVVTTGIQLDRITDVDMLKMIERQQRGGLCYVSSKKACKGE